MGRRIKDEFASLTTRDGRPMSRQQRYQLRKKARGLCMICGEPAIGNYCLQHKIRARELMRKRLGSGRRYRNALSYRIGSGQARKKLRVRRDL